MNFWTIKTWCMAGCVEEKKIITVPTIYGFPWYNVGIFMCNKLKVVREWGGEEEIKLVGVCEVEKGGTW